MARIPPPEAAAGERHAPGTDHSPIWYELHVTALECKGYVSRRAAGDYRARDRIAWGFTNNGADVLDLYIKTFNPAILTSIANRKWKKADVRRSDQSEGCRMNTCVWL
jgi:acyl-homoserine lactone acylase PvdQ